MQMSSRRSLTWSVPRGRGRPLAARRAAHAGAVRADEEGDGEFPDEPGIFIDFQSEAFDEIEVCYRVDPPAGDPIEDCTLDFFAFVPIEAPGNYTVTVTSVPSNCAVVSLNPVTVDVTADGPDGGSAHASFLLDCGTLADPTAGPVTVDAYVCEDASRAGEIDFLVGSGFVLASDLSCRLAGPGERQLPPHSARGSAGAGDGDGRHWAGALPGGAVRRFRRDRCGIGDRLAGVPVPASLRLRDRRDLRVTAIIYVAAVPTPTPSTGDEPGRSRSSISFALTTSVRAVTTFSSAPPSRPKCSQPVSRSPTVSRSRAQPSRNPASSVPVMDLPPSSPIFLQDPTR